MLMSILLAAKSLPELLPFTALLATAPTFFAAWMPFRVLSILLPSRVYGQVDDFSWGCYQKLVLFFFEKLSPVQVVFHGDVEEILNKKECALYISNHQSTVDWIVADMLAVRQGSLGHMRYILKDGLRFLPLYGFYFHQHNCVYVRRSRKFNSDIMKKNLESIPKTRKNTWLVIFPEGTRFKPGSSENATTSRSPTQEEVPLKNVLTPKMKAFQLSVESLRSYFNAVYDVTIMYSQTRQGQVGNGVARVLAPTMNDYMHGSDEKLHIVVKRFDIKEIPFDETGIQKWLTSVFQEKDRLMTTYFETGEVLPESKSISLPWSEVLPATLFFAGLNAVLWSTNIGRKIYFTSTLAGGLFTVVYMGLRKVA
ncbi:1-acyl-sn-glycerol-3-phosphate acyltransferase epsilon-like [Paramacrobiotus metropolitanus]|uniref:1-acyl-sn-glycerol-3-phosphate acyltransferase epsilon-like n=1 Tax=Paramacrobiotus metropolitanus TaxID=2943436 RepID=UPI0024456C49|nr:1-acyl-sn-glycerol-3-phosphate acyltransferase epsilon-like [Paramacrobiotus metropolitanus]XP_055350464.1 1-acyl-sn-glycerol-3-phosphate acyltransferase epsilon-like [Paramacrobiotus metropolitanus]